MSKANRVALEGNIASWDFANNLANSRKGDYAQALASGWPALPETIVETLDLGPNSRILHPMCNDGREAIYLALKTKAHVTGVDFSDPAISFAKRTLCTLGLDGVFERQDVLSWMDGTEPASFDAVLTTLGTLWWVPDLSIWFKLISQVVRPGGVYVLWDFHPIVHCFDKNQILYRDYPFDGMSIRHDTGIDDYTRNQEIYQMPARVINDIAPIRNPYPVTDYRWTLGSLLKAILDNQKLRLKQVVEQPYLWGEAYFPWLIQTKSLRFEPKGGKCRVPLSIQLAIEIL